MKFLTKNPQSSILTDGLTYTKNATNNLTLRGRLMVEQYNFCAYTEKYLQPLDSVELEHLDSTIKYKDNYFNYYAVIRNANLYKQDEKYTGAHFLQSLFFQNQQQLVQRIAFASNIYYEIDVNDVEARDFIDFLGLNHPTLSQQRSNHVKRLREVFQNAQYSDEEIIDYFSNHKEELSHITAIESEFNLDLFEVIKN
jgi:hypothetical protein